MNSINPIQLHKMSCKEKKKSSKTKTSKYMETIF